jgi:hypothetical protein
MDETISLPLHEKRLWNEGEVAFFVSPRPSPPPTAVLPDRRFDRKQETVTRWPAAASSAAAVHRAG